MANYDLEFWAEITGLCTAVRDTTVYRSTQANTFDWKEEMERGDLPEEYWIIHMGVPVEEDYATDTVCYRYPLAIMLLRPEHLTPAEAADYDTSEDLLEELMADLRDRFVTYSGDKFQLVGRNPVRHLSEDDPANEVYISARSSRKGAVLSVAPLVGEAI